MTAICPSLHSELHQWDTSEEQPPEDKVKASLIMRRRTQEHKCTHLTAISVLHIKHLEPELCGGQGGPAGQYHRGEELRVTFVLCGRRDEDSLRRTTNDEGFILSQLTSTISV